MRKLKVLSLFSGGGLGDLALEMAGMEIVGQIELDEVCQKLLKLRWPKVPKGRNIKNVKKEKLPKADVIAGGPPCQGFSIAGKQRGKADDRYLWPAMFEIIKSVKPRYVLFENVTGIVKLALDDVLTDLESENYTCWTFNIPACGINAPHKRERIWIIAYSNSIQYRGEKSRSNAEENRVSKVNRKEISTAGEFSGANSQWRSEEYVTNSKCKRSVQCQSKEQSRSEEGIFKRSNSNVADTRSTESNGISGKQRKEIFSIGRENKNVAYAEGVERERSITTRNTAIKSKTQIGDGNCVIKNTKLSGAGDNCRKIADQRGKSSTDRQESLRQEDRKVGSSRINTANSDAQDSVCERGRGRSQDRRQVLDSQATQVEVKGSNRKVRINDRNSNNEGLQRFWRDEECAGERIIRTADWEADWRDVAIESCDGGMDDGSAVELDGFKLSKAKHRVERLKILGNGQVTPLVYELGKFIIKHWEHIEGSYNDR